MKARAAVGRGRWGITELAHFGFICAACCSCAPDESRGTSDGTAGAEAGGGTEADARDVSLPDRAASAVDAGSVGFEAGGVDAYAGDAGTFDAPCSVEVRVDLVFYDNTCFTSWVECRGEVVASGRGFCDLEAITCDGPDRTEHDTVRYTQRAGPCHYCSEGDFDDVRCMELPADCGRHTIEHVASGSPEGGVHPFTADCGAP